VEVLIFHQLQISSGNNNNWAIKGLLAKVIASILPTGLLPATSQIKRKDFYQRLKRSDGCLLDNLVF